MSDGADDAMVMPVDVESALALFRCIPLKGSMGGDACARRWAAANAEGLARRGGVEIFGCEGCAFGKARHKIIAKHEPEALSNRKRHSPTILGRAAPPALRRQIDEARGERDAARRQLDEAVRQRDKAVQQRDDAQALLADALRELEAARAVPPPPAPEPKRPLTRAAQVEVARLRTAEAIEERDALRADLAEARRENAKLTRAVKRALSSRDNWKARAVARRLESQGRYADARARLEKGDDGT